MYKHSNEVEEVGVVNLNGVNIESNPEMEALLGVSFCTRGLFIITNMFTAFLRPAETLHLHAVHIIKLVRRGRTECQGAQRMDI